MRQVYRDNGYLEVKAPQLLDRVLWEKTGHWDNFRESMFTTESENRHYALKPMNCPGHIQIYKSELRSYRDLPLRYGEFGQCHRNEPSGALHGIMRVRGFTQDDGHIFCTEDQILPECLTYTALLQRVYRDFGFKDIVYKIATRPARRIGADEVWDKAEHALMESLRQSACPFDTIPGEGAFYGPKIEYHLKDSIGRSWQCGTMQVDFLMTGRLGAEYVAEDNTRRVPVILHRAIVGSLERFIGILLEHYAGALPLWLAPVQVAVASISEHQRDYARQLAEELKKQGFRAASDLRDDKIGYKIRSLALQKLPYICVVGDKELQAGTVAVRSRGGVDLGVMSLQTFSEHLRLEVEQRSNSPVPGESAHARSN
jgi:threonyl-tRNA synthetase